MREDCLKGGGGGARFFFLGGVVGFEVDGVDGILTPSSSSLNGFVSSVGDAGFSDFSGSKLRTLSWNRILGKGVTSALCVCISEGIVCLFDSGDLVYE